MALIPRPAEHRPASRDLRRAIWRRRMQRIRGRSHAGLAVGLAGVLVVLLNLLAAYFDVRWHLPGSGGQQLSPGMDALLQRAEGRLAITAIVPRSDPLFERLRLTLNAIRHRAWQMNAVQVHVAFVDPYRDMALAAALATDYGCSGRSLLFEGGGRRECVGLEPERAAPDADGRPAAAPVDVEGLCATAIRRLYHASPSTLYMLAGHGERDITDYDAQTGYATLAREIRRDGYALQALQLPLAREIPADCGALIVAGPRRAISSDEQAAISAYLAAGGRLLLLADRGQAGGLESLIEKLGLRFAGLTAVGGTVDGYALASRPAAGHPVTRDLANTALIFVDPQVIDIVGGGDAADRAASDVLVTAPADAWGEAQPDVMPRQFDPGQDRKGPLAVAVALQRGSGADIGIKPMRAVIVGDSHFAVNALLEGGRTGNRDLVLNALHWLTDDPQPSMLSASTATRLHIGLTRRERLRFLIATAVAWPAAFALVGAILIAIRRRG